MKQIILALCLIGFGTFSGPALAEDPVFSFSEADPAMNAAIEEARASLPKFLEHGLEADGMALRDTLIKVRTLSSISGSRRSNAPAKPHLSACWPMSPMSSAPLR
jgi:hypothetical protein